MKAACDEAIDDLNMEDNIFVHICMTHKYLILFDCSVDVVGSDPTVKGFWVLFSPWRLPKLGIPKKSSMYVSSIKNTGIEFPTLGVDTCMWLVNFYQDEQWEQEELFLIFTTNSCPMFEV